MNELFRKFRLTFKTQRTNIELPGSPERCLARLVVEDNTGKLWLVEKLKESQTIWRESVGQLLCNLYKHNTPYVHAPATTEHGNTVVIQRMAPYQLTPFIQGTPLQRPSYCADSIRGEAIGNFILALQENGEKFSIPEESTPPLPAYVEEIIQTIQALHPDMYEKLADILPQLDDFFEKYESLPTALAHGDCHPLNIIWNDKEIAGVIDWEFTGRKIALYDAVNCIGCVGFEHPNWLINGLCPALIGTLYHGSENFRISYQQLIPAIIALRFAWLSEWLRKKDTEMQQMELDYMHLLVKGRAEIEAYWQKHLDSH